MSAKNIVEPFPGRTDPSVWLRRHPDSVRHRLLLPCDQIWLRHWCSIASIHSCWLMS